MVNHVNNEITIQQKRLIHNMRQQDWSDRTGIRRTLISDVEQGTCLLMPTDLNRLCEVAEAPVTQLYPDWLLRDICRVYRPAPAPERPEVTKYRSVSVRLRQDMATQLTKSNLRKCGYKDLTAWVYACLNRFCHELQEVEREE